MARSTAEKTSKFLGFMYTCARDYLRAHPCAFDINEAVNEMWLLTHSLIERKRFMEDRRGHMTYLRLQYTYLCHKLCEWKYYRKTVPLDQDILEDNRVCDSAVFAGALPEVLAKLDLSDKAKRVLSGLCVGKRQSDISREERRSPHATHEIVKGIRNRILKEAVKQGHTVPVSLAGSADERINQRRANDTGKRGAGKARVSKEASGNTGRDNPRGSAGSGSAHGAGCTAAISPRRAP